jgi:hypothetical protein
MNNLSAVRNFKRRVLTITSVAVLAMGISSWQAGAQIVNGSIVNLMDANSFAAINVADQVGMYRWDVDGQSQLAQQWFWYRVGLTAEASINTIGLPAIVIPDARAVYLTYTSPLFSVRVDYLLTGGAAGSGSSTINESITIKNLTQTVLDFHFFQYSDFDLKGTAANDTLSLGKNLAGKFNEAIQTELPSHFSESAVTPGADHGEAGIWPSTINKLNDGVPSNLSDVAGPVGPGDVAWAFQWDRLLGPAGSAGDTLVISKLKSLQVPEPSTMALAILGAGLVGVAVRRRKIS